MVAAIRAQDSTHSIIFGDVEWYGIDKLVSRQPLADTNVIYAFHDYEPFIFTHQGASWANLGATHDLPYPYDPARWSRVLFGPRVQREHGVLDARCAQELLPRR